MVYSVKQSRRTNWYYCPQALSEYKIEFLDIAAKQDGILFSMSPPDDMKNDYSDVLFCGALPSETNYNETSSFKHYLHCLKKQCENATCTNYSQTRDLFIITLKTAASIIMGLRKANIRGQNRDFSDVIDAIEAAVSLFDNDCGFVMDHEWDSL
jgi:hypothetical protein